LIDPAERCVFVYLPDRPTLLFDSMDAVLPVPGFAGAFELTVEALFGWLLE
jgi:hypothetical protein